jgi:hypothetical protein
MDTWDLWFAIGHNTSLEFENHASVRTLLDIKNPLCATNEDARRSIHPRMNAELGMTGHITTGSGHRHNTIFIYRQPH